MVPQQQLQQNVLPEPQQQLQQLQSKEEQSKPRQQQQSGQKEELTGATTIEKIARDDIP